MLTTQMFCDGAKDMTQQTAMGSGSAGVSVDQQTDMSMLVEDLLREKPFVGELDSTLKPRRQPAQPVPFPSD